MPVFDLFSHRKRVAAGDAPDVFAYDNLPEALRVQISFIWRDAIGPFYVRGGYGSPPPNNNETWETIHDAVAREHGLSALGSQLSIADRCVTYLLESHSVDAALDEEKPVEQEQGGLAHLRQGRIRLSRGDRMRELRKNLAEDQIRQTGGDALLVEAVTCPRRLVQFGC